MSAIRGQNPPSTAARRRRTWRDHHHHAPRPADRANRTRDGSPAAGDRSGAGGYPRVAQAYGQGFRRGNFGVASRRPQITMALVIDASIVAAWAFAEEHGNAGA